MNIRPLYDRIVVKRIEEQETTRNGIVIPDSAQEKPQEGEVIAIGHGKRLEDGKLVAPRRQSRRPHPFGKYSGSETKAGRHGVSHHARRRRSRSFECERLRRVQKAKLIQISTHKEIINGKTDYL